MEIWQYFIPCGACFFIGFWIGACVQQINTESAEVKDNFKQLRAPLEIVVPKGIQADTPKSPTKGKEEALPSPETPGKRVYVENGVKYTVFGE